MGKKWYWYEYVIYFLIYFILLMDSFIYVSVFFYCEYKNIKVIYCINILNKKKRIKKKNN